MKVLSRISIIFFWILLIAIVFYFPRWKDQVLPQYDKTLNIFAWGDILDVAVLKEFQQATGIKINLSFYASNEELQVKMKATGGEGYDLIMPSDYAVAHLIKNDLLQPLDHTKLHFLDTLYPPLLNHSFDPHNRYSVPFEWEIFGFAIDTTFFQDRPLPDTWKAVFDPAFIDYQIAINNDPIEVFHFAANYLFGPLESVNHAQFAAIRKLLLEQRKWILAYSDFRADYYIATGNTPLAISTTSYIKRVQSSFPNIRLIIPKEGSFVLIENFCIPKPSQKQEAIYAFLNFLYQPKSLIQHQKTFTFLTASNQILDSLNLDADERALFDLTPEEFKKYQFIRNLAPQQQVRDLWVEIKSF